MLYMPPEHPSGCRAKIWVKNKEHWNEVMGKLETFGIFNKSVKRFEKSGVALYVQNKGDNFVTGYSPDTNNLIWWHTSFKDTPDLTNHPDWCWKEKVQQKKESDMENKPIYVIMKSKEQLVKEYGGSFRDIAHNTGRWVGSWDGYLGVAKGYIRVDSRHNYKGICYSFYEDEACTKVHPFLISHANTSWSYPRELFQEIAPELPVWTHYDTNTGLARTNLNSWGSSQHLVVGGIDTVIDTLANKMKESAKAKLIALGITPKE